MEKNINKIAFAFIVSAVGMVLAAQIASADESASASASRNTGKLGSTGTVAISEMSNDVSSDLPALSYDFENTPSSSSVHDGVKIAASSRFKKIPPVSTEGTRFSGNVSWYGPGFNGKLTASGKKFDMNQLVCAHKTLPFYTKVLVENPKNGKSVTIDVLDRGPFVGDRIIDLSREAARRLGTLTGGVAFVECLIVQEGGKK